MAMRLLGCRQPLSARQSCLFPCERSEYLRLAHRTHRLSEPNPARDGLVAMTALALLNNMCRVIVIMRQQFSDDAPCRTLRNS